MIKHIGHVTHMFTTLQPRIQRTQRNDKNMIKNLENPRDLCKMIAALLSIHEYFY